VQPGLCQFGGDWFGLVSGSVIAVSDMSGLKKPYISRAAALISNKQRLQRVNQIDTISDSFTLLPSLQVPSGFKRGVYSWKLQSI